MYSEYGYRCPKHPDLATPCQICGELSRDVNPESGDFTIVKGINWQHESLMTYNTKQPNPTRRFNPSIEMQEDLGPSDWGEPIKIQPAPPTGGISPDRPSTVKTREFD